MLITVIPRARQLQFIKKRQIAWGRLLELSLAGILGQVCNGVTPFSFAMRRTLAAIKAKAAPVYPYDEQQTRAC